ncbi:MAG TPA: recombination mediator RecR [Thermoanaerobaculia bacterium]|nr:recombination mediator RecR [Thermoanaerobaculia bacterium]
MASNDPLARLVGELARLPSIGPKTAARLAHHVLKVDRSEVEALAAALVEVKEKLFHCSLCNSITAEDPCRFCTDPQRDRSRICVVEEPFNIAPLERTGEYDGLYHVLLGALRPHRGIGPEELDVGGLLGRLEGVEEVILATNPNVEGEATALYLARVIKPRGPRVSRLAFGMPVGGDIEYTDEATLGRSLAGRREL